MVMDPHPSAGRPGRWRRLGRRLATVGRWLVARFPRPALLAWVLVLTELALVALLAQFWTAWDTLQAAEQAAAKAGTPAPEVPTVTLSFLGLEHHLTPTFALLVLAAVGGALGGGLHAISSLALHIAHGDFDRRWTTWYLTNSLVGAAIATIFLFVLQAGLIGAGGQSAASTNLYGVAAAATLSGLFSRHAVEKLKKIFDVAFDVSASPRPPQAVPWLTRLEPRTIPASPQPVPVVINGSQLPPGCKVEVGGTLTDPIEVHADAVRVMLPAGSVAAAGTVRVRVLSPEGVFSNEGQLTVT